MENHSNEEFKEILNEVWNILSQNITAQEKPQGYILGGQPAAGKAGLVLKIESKLDHNVISINGDDHRKYHKNYSEYQEKYGSEASKYTGNFAGAMTEALIKKAVSERMNLIIEGTFRTTETPIKTLKGLKYAGYSTHIAIQTCPKELSLISTKNRYYLEETVNDGFGRLTPEDNHNLTASVLAKNVEEVYKTGLAETLYVRNRSEVLYDSTKTKDPFKSKIIEKELNRNAEKEINGLKESISRLLSKEILLKIFPKTEKNESNNDNKSFKSVV